MKADVSDIGIDFLKKFLSIVMQSPVAVVTLALSTFCGYGISFILFDYRRSTVRKSHYLFHVPFGLGYASVIFCVVNYDLLSHELTMEQITPRIPVTLMISFVVAFVIMFFGSIWRQFSPPR